MENFFSQNPVFQGLANLGGVIGLAVIMYKTFGVGKGFIKTWYHSSFKKSLQKVRRRNISKSFWCASDPTLFSAFIALASCQLLMVSIMFILYTSREPKRKSLEEFESGFRIIEIPYELYSSYYKLFSGVTLAIILLLLVIIGYKVLKVYIVSRNVLHLRLRFGARIRRSVKFDVDPR